LVMILVVLPLSALHERGPYQLHDLIKWLLVHMVVDGLPISYSVRRFATVAVFTNGLEHRGDSRKYDGTR